MGDFVRINVSGIGELKASFDKLSQDLKERALRSAGYAGAKVICDQAIENAPYFTGTVAQGHPPPGTLKNSIIVKRITELCKDYRQVYYVTVRRGQVGGNHDAYYALWVEEGHFYRKAWQALKGGDRRKAAQRAALAASGATYVPAHPYMRTAFEMTKEAAKKAIIDRLSTYITLANK